MTTEETALSAPSFSVGGKVALISGSTSGIGLGVAEMIASAGANVVVSGRDESRGAEAVNQITATGGGEATFVAGDITDPSHCATLVDQTLPIRLTPMTATCRVPPLSRVKLGIGWSRGVARDAEQ